MTDTESIKEAIESVVKTRFEEGQIVSVSVQPDVDADGEDILRVRIVFNANRPTLDAELASSLIRHLRLKIEEIGETAFPIMSFVSKADIGKTTADAL